MDTVPISEIEELKFKISKVKQESFENNSQLKVRSNELREKLKKHRGVIAWKKSELRKLDRALKPGMLPGDVALKV